jgi:YQGE family putative transporter
MLSAIHSIVGTFFGTFLIAYIMQISQNEAVALSIYNIAFYAAITIGFLLLADYVKRKNKMLVYRLSIIIQFLCLSAIALFQDTISPYIAIFGAVYGLAMAFRHCPLNIIVGEKIKKRLMAPFIGYRNMVGGIVSVMTPALLGIFITVGSYEEMAAAMCAFLVLEFFLSFFLRSRNVSDKKFGLACFVSSAKRSILIRRVYLVEFLGGFSQYGPLGIVLTMYIVYIFQSNLKLGILTSAFAGVAIAANFLFGRFGRPKMFPKILLFSNILIGAAAIGFAGWAGAVTFVIYQLSVATALNFINNIADTNFMNASNSACVQKDSRAEFFVAGEMALDTGRILSLLVLFTIGFSGHIEWLKYYLLAMTACILFSGTVSVKICRHGLCNR